MFPYPFPLSLTIEKKLFLPMYPLNHIYYLFKVTYEATEPPPLRICPLLGVELPPPPPSIRTRTVHIPAGRGGGRGGRGARRGRRPTQLWYARTVNNVLQREEGEEVDSDDNTPRAPETPNEE